MVICRPTYKNGESGLPRLKSICICSFGCRRNENNMARKKCAKKGGRWIDWDKDWDSGCLTMEYYLVRL